MSGSITDVEFVMRNLAENIVANEKYFGELDAVVGDGDFGYSLARGFEIVLDQWDDFDRSDPGVFLTKIAAATSARIGGTSGPIWGTAMLRAGVQLKEHPRDRGADVVRALRASIEGIKARGQADVGDKTLLDALVPAVDTLEAELATGRLQRQGDRRDGRRSPTRPPRTPRPCRPCVAARPTPANAASGRWTPVRRRSPSC